MCQGKVRAGNSFIARTLGVKFRCTGYFTLAMTFLLTFIGFASISLQEVEYLLVIISVSRLRGFLNLELLTTRTEFLE